MQYLEFVKKVDEKRKLDRDIADRPNKTAMDWVRDYRERIHFGVNVWSNIPSAWTYNHHAMTLFILDGDDLDYLYKKYSKRLHAEMKEKIEEIKSSYEGVKKIE